jgi:GNAT superfamily N-acetyltransferase
MENERISKNKLKDFKIRFANKKDTELILSFLRQLAEYEKKLNCFVVKENDIVEIFFKRKVAEAIIGEYNGYSVAIAVFLYSFPSFLGKPGIYLEDLFVMEKFRGNGLGRLMLSYLANIAKDRGCEELQWTVLSRSEQSRKFYNNIGAEECTEEIVYRLSGGALEKLAQDSSS